MLLTILITFLLIFITIILCCMFIPSYRTYTLVNKIHGPKGLPFLGMGWRISQLKFTELLDFFRDLTIEFPRLTLLWLLGVPVVIMQDPDDLAEILGNMTNIEKGVEYEPMKLWLNEGLLLSIGEKWRSRRKLLTPTFHFKILEENLSSMQKHAQKLVSKLLEMKDQNIDIHELVTLCTLDVMCETAMGIQLRAQDNQSKDYVKCVKSIGALTVFRMQNLYLHRDWLFGLTPKGFEFNKYLNQLHSFTLKIIKERKQAFIESKKLSEDIYEDYENSGKSKKRKAFLDLLLELDTDNKLSEKDIREEVDTFLFEGHDTTAAALTFSLYALSVHQDVQAKVVKELEEVLQGNDGVINKQNLNDMKYLEKVIKEALRIYPSVPYISRMLNSDVHLKEGVVLPEGTNTIILPFLLHRDPKLYPDPLKFDPERFTNENSSARHPYAYLPFSAGPRNCIGQKFAMMEIKVVLSIVLKSLHLEAVTKPEDVQYQPLLILRTEEPILIRATPRKIKL